ncbi:MAG: peptidoglycan-binding protein [Pseudomonadota bacterium]
MSLSSTVSFSELNINRRTINGNLRGSRNSTMLGLIGNPRGTYDQECRHPTNPQIAALMVTVDFGPFRATGLRPAVNTLQNIMAEIRSSHRDVHDALSTAGMLCCRLVRGSLTAISNHSWGTAIDLKLEGKLDRRGDGRTQKGLLEIHRIFNRHGFFWGAAFGTEDSMHFEASDQLIRKWADDGEFGELPGALDDGLLNFGDRGPEVEELQQVLNLQLALDIDVDGIFGKDTQNAVKEFQRRNGLSIDGVVGLDTAGALGIELG